MKIVILVLVLLAGMAASPAILSAEKVGHVQTLKGTASIIRGPVTIAVSIGTAVHREDRVRTSEGSAMGIVLDDDTTLSLGPRSEMIIKAYAFEPNEGRFAFVIRMIKGTFVYFSGLMGRLSPDAIRIEIPEATIAVRGTRLLVAVQE